MRSGQSVISSRLSNANVKKHQKVNVAPTFATAKKMP